MRYLLTSLAVVLPCFWHERIAAGDLASHMYNVWLAQLIRAGEAPGLYLATIRTNVLFDLWAEWLVGLAGFAWGERLAMAAVVLTFFWGSFVLTRRLGRGSAWPVAPLLAMFAYGWVFHMGFVNFYWSMGFCLWGLAMAESGRRWERRLWWLPLLPALAAHSLPVGWAGALWAYGQAMRRWPRRRAWLLGGGLAGIGAVTAAVRWKLPSVWAPDQALAMLGFDQLWLFDRAYFAVAVGFLAVWGLGLLWLLYARTPGRLGQYRVVHYAVLTAVGVLLFPWVVHPPGFAAPLSFITHRMSLGAGVLLCALAPLSGRAGRLAYATVPLAAVFFGMVYRDTGTVNEFETKLRAAVRTAPKGARVVAPYEREWVRVYAYGHAVDRACIGHCFSYANYEAATTQFRVRAAGPNGIVAHDNDTSIGLQTRKHTVREGEAPLHYFRWQPDKKEFEHLVLGVGEKL